MSKIPCAVIRDLLPSYVEKLTGEETNGYIKDHIEGCQPCRQALEMMSSSFGNETDKKEENSDISDKPIDFLKKNRRRNIRITVISLACAAIIALAIVFINRYVAGYYYYDPTGDLFSYNLQINDHSLEADVFSVQNIYKITGAEIYESQDDGTVLMKIKAVPSGIIARLLYGDSYHVSYTSKNEISRVKANERIIWQSGTEISMMTSRIFGTAHPFMGDMPANASTANNLGISSFLGPFTNELKSDQEPYGWKLILEKDIPGDKAESKEKDMENYAFVLLAMTGNLDEVVFEYTVDGKTTEKKITAAQASDYFGQDIKVCMDSIDYLEELLHKTGLIYNAFLWMETSGDSDLRFNVKVVNSADETLKSIMMTIYTDGKLTSSQGAENADGTSLEKSQLLQFGIMQDDLGAAFNKDSEITISLSVCTEDGSQYNIPDIIRIPPIHGFLHDIHITGNSVDGFSISQ